ncbi:MAG: hypothetical protein HXY25_05275, partial [Alphaproteobacteria bacterium]|nr:hypothetical protein [Alphaproteobacteria bacterium]
MAFGFARRLVFPAALVFGLVYMIPARPQSPEAAAAAARASWEQLLSMGDGLARAGETGPALAAYRDALRFAGDDVHE